MAMSARRVRMRLGTTALSLLLALTMDATGNATTLAFSEASVAGEAVGDTLGKAHAEGQQDSGPPPRDDEHGGSNKWPYADVNASSSSWRGSNDSSCEDDEIVPATCGYYSRAAHGCSRPRTCRDCLELDDCMVNQFGACINMTKYGYDPALDYHKAFEFNLTGSGATAANTTLRYHFPSKNATYCAADDATCVECKRTVFAGDVSDSRFCVGANNCICIASCEATGWEQLAGGLRCGPPPRPKAFAAQGPPNLKPDDDKTSSGVNWRDVWTMGGIPALVVVVGILVVRSHRLETKRRDEAARQEQQGSGGEGSGPEGTTTSAQSSSSSRPGRLNLAGWQASRREQKQKKEDLALNSARGEKDVSPKHHFVDLLDTRQGVNPQVTVLAAPVMGAVVVEASAPPMSPQHEDDGMEPPSAPSFDSEFEYDQEVLDSIDRV